MDLEDHLDQRSSDEYEGHQEGLRAYLGLCKRIYRRLEAEGRLDQVLRESRRASFAIHRTAAEGELRSLMHRHFGRHWLCVLCFPKPLFIVTEVEERAFDLPTTPIRIEWRPKPGRPRRRRFASH